MKEDIKIRSLARAGKVPLEEVKRYVQEQGVKMKPIWKALFRVHRFLKTVDEVVKEDNREL